MGARARALAATRRQMAAGRRAGRGAVQPLPGLAVAGLEPDLIILNEG